jgi:hypothetical protein
MEYTFCTIITNDYLPYTQVLHNSITRFNHGIELNVLIVDKYTVDDVEISKNINIYGSGIVCDEGIGYRIKNKYKNESLDKFRWTMKPIFINYLMNEHGYEKVIYIDPDVYFLSDYNFLFKELDVYSVILTPHWRNSNPYLDSGNFHTNLTDGLFNAGFIGVSKGGGDAMDWWAKVCHYACEKDIMNGLYDDQGYLNLLPIYFDNIGIIKHMGCNVANWNMLICKRESQIDGTVLINGEYPIVFVHFTSSTIRDILKGIDSHLYPYLTKYAQELLKYNPKHDIIAEYQNRAQRKHKMNNNIIAIVKNKIFRFMCFF